jgi:two-component system, NtrC family, sensor kinase
MDRLKAPSRVFFFLAALGLTLLVAALGIVSFQRKLESFQPLGFEAKAAQGGFAVLKVDEPTTGVLPGDLILMIGGQQATDHAGLSRSLRAQPQAELLLLRADSLTTQVYQRPDLAVDLPYLVLAAIGVFYLLIGLYTAIKDRRGSATVFLLFCAASAALFLISPRLPLVDGLDRWLYFVDLMARLFLPALTLHLFATFPSRLFAGLETYHTPFFYLPSSLFLVFHVDQALNGGTWLFGKASASDLAFVDRFELIWLIGGSLLAAACLVIRLHRQPLFEERRQTLWLLAGLVGGYLPFACFFAVPWMLGQSVERWLEVLAVVPLALVPLAFAWAIFKYRLLDLGLILRDVTTYSLTAIVGLFAFQLIHLLIQTNLGTTTALARNVLTFGAGLFVAGVLAPTRNVIRAGIERLRWRNRLGPRRLLNDLGQELLHERELDHLGEALLDHLADALAVRCNLFLADGEQLLPFRPGDLPRALSFEAFSPSFWTADFEKIESFVVPGTAPAGEQRLFAAGFRYALPITVRQRRLGALVLGFKYDEEPLDSEELELVRNLLDQAALALENARLLEEAQVRLLAMTRLESYNKGILESTPAGIAVLDDGARIHLANRAFASICGLSRSALIGRPISEVLPVQPLPCPQDGLIEISFCELSGEERYLQLQTSETRDEQGQRILIVQDISSRVSMESALREKEHLASLGMLAAGVAHEVNTPLTGISSYAQFLIADTPKDDPRYQILKKMELQTFRAAQIVNSLLDFARNRGEAMSRVSLDLLIGESLGLLEQRARAQQVELDWQPPDQKVEVNGCEGEIHQVLTNLVANAIDAQAHQSVKRSVKVRLERQAERQLVLLRVSDNGPGIAEERLETIFKPFFSSKIGRGGTGLGLAITHNIVRRHGGQMRVENHPKPQRGCTFTVELPDLKGSDAHSFPIPVATTN